MYQRSLLRRNFKHHRVEREALVVAEYPHPVGGEPWVTYYLTSEHQGEEPGFHNGSRREFLTWYPKEFT